MLQMKKMEDLSDYNLSKFQYNKVCDYVEQTIVPYMKKKFKVVKEVYYEAWIDLWDYLVPSEPYKIRNMTIPEAAFEIADFLIARHNEYCQNRQLTLSAGE